MSPQAAACWICLDALPQDGSAARDHPTCIHAFFDVPTGPQVAFGRLDITNWADEHAGRLSISGYQLKDRERLPEEPEEAAIKVPPDWACEILSDRTEAMDRGSKRRIYRREGVGHLWLCDPQIETLEVYHLEGGRWTELDTHEGDAKVRAEPFESIELDLARLWRW